MPTLSVRRRLLASTAFTTLALTSASPSGAQVTTWLATPVSSDFNTAANWDTGTVPTDQALFSNSTTTTVSISADTTIGGIAIDLFSPNYAFNVSGARLTFNGFGFATVGFSTASFAINGPGAGLNFLLSSNPGSASYTLGNQTTLDFSNSSSGGSATFTLGNQTTVNFRNTSNPGSAAFYAASDSIMNFRDTTNAGSATIGAGVVHFYDNTGAGRAAISITTLLNFHGTTTADQATINNAGLAEFRDSTTAANATIVNIGRLSFLNNSTAANAVIVNSGPADWINFRDNTTAANATITNQSTLAFYDRSTAADATIANQSILAFSDHSTAGHATISNDLTLQFDGTASADSATITNNREQTFTGSSTAANAAITNAGGATLRFMQGATGGSATLTNSGTLLFEGNATAGNAMIVNNAGGLVDFSQSTGPAGDGRLSAGSIAGAGGFSLGANQLTVGSGGASTEVGGVIFGTGGSLVKTGAGTLTLTGANSYTGGTTIAAGTLQVGNGGTTGSIIGNIANNGTLAFNRADTSTFGGVISGSGGVEKRGIGTLALTAANTYTGGTTITAGTLQVGDGGTTGSIIGNVANNGTLAFNRADASTFGGIISGSGGVEKRGIGTLALTAANTYTGGTTITAGTLQIGNGGTTGSIIGNITNNGALVFDRADALGVGDTISGSGTLEKRGAGTLTLTGTSSYTGATMVNAGTLSVNGAIAASSGVTVNAGATLGGIGQLPGIIVNAGGTLAPGNSIGSITVNGNLQFATGSFYTVEVSPTAADRTNVTGIANLTGATVRASGLPLSFRGQTYAILNATGGLGGTSFDGLAVSGSFAQAPNVHLTYDANTAYLVVDPGTVALGPNATRNQSNVAGAINRTVESGGVPPAGFDALLNMTSDAAGRALGQLSGETSTQGQTGAFQLGGSYLALLSDVFGTRRDDGAASLGYADDQRASALRSAFAALDKPSFTAPRWDLWGSAFGGGGNLSGDAGTGSVSSATRAGAVAAGADHRFAPNSLVGFSLAGGVTRWSSGNGGGSSDVIMGGVYGRHTAGSAYLAAAVSYANYWMSTTRTVTVAGLDRLDSRFNAQSFGGRIEAGYRLPARFLDVNWTPYGAVQAQNFRTPDHSETATTGSNQFGLRYAGRTATAVRAELGVQTERRIAIDRGSELYLFGRTAYARDSVSDPAVSATFVALGSTGSFTAFGAQPSQHLMLSSAGAEWRFGSGASFLLKADGEWGERSMTWGGMGRIRYAW